MPHRFASLLSSAAWLAATAALARTAPSAQPTVAPTVAPVTVEGVAPPKVVYERAKKFVETFATAPNPEINQIARWRDPVCVETIGLIDREEAYVKERIGAVAQAIGLHLGRARCSANIEIVFTDQPQAMMDLVAKKRERILGYYYAHDKKALKTVTHTIQAWYVTATNGRYQELPDFQDEITPEGCGDSLHFTGCYQSVFKNIFVVVDTSTLKIDNLGLVTDYLVMLTLAQPQTKSLDHCNSLPSVIDLIAKSDCENRDQPDGLTPGDAAYLTALYQSDPEARKWIQQGEITERMAKILVAANAVKR